jgi:hypothetical protein
MDCISMLEASLQTRILSQAVSQPAVTRRPMRRRTVGPVSSELGKSLAGRDSLVPSCSKDSLWLASG